MVAEITLPIMTLQRQDVPTLNPREGGRMGEFLLKSPSLCPVLVFSTWRCVVAFNESKG